MGDKERDYNPYCVEQVAPDWLKKMFNAQDATDANVMEKKLREELNEIYPHKGCESR